MSGIERSYSEYKTELACAVLPGDGHYERECRSALSELLVDMLQSRAELSLYSIGNRLAAFVPLATLESTDDWKEHNLKRWCEQVRPMIFKALSDYFIEGGHEHRIEVQRRLLDILAVSGIQIVGRDVLDSVLPWAGDWKKRFLDFALTGRPQGVRFLCQPEFSSVPVSNAMKDAGFNAEQVNEFLAAIN